MKKENRGEADRVFTIFTQDFGKLEILGRAIRKITSKLRAGADIFNLSEIEFIQGKTSKTLTDAILIEKFKNLKSDPEKLEAAYKTADVLDSLIGFEEKDEKIWQLLITTFRNIEISKYRDIVCYYFLWNLFSILGYAPELYNCPVCSRKLLPETLFFSPAEGGLVCWQCFSKLDNGRKKEAKGIDVGTVKVLRVLLEKDFDVVNRLKIENKIVENLDEISGLYLNYLKGEFSKQEN